jgi:hypothetical protein
MVRANCAALAGTSNLWARVGALITTIRRRLRRRVD